MALSYNNLNNYAIMTYYKIPSWWWSINNSVPIGYFSIKIIYYSHHARIVDPCRNWIPSVAASMWPIVLSSVRLRIKHSMRVGAPTTLNPSKNKWILNYLRIPGKVSLALGIWAILVLWILGYSAFHMYSNSPSIFYQINISMTSMWIIPWAPRANYVLHSLKC